MADGDVIDMRYIAVPTSAAAGTNAPLLIPFSRREGVCGGRWCLHGHRLWPGIVQAGGKASYPYLTDDEVKACALFGEDAP